MALLIGHFSVNGIWKKLVLLLLVYPLTILINSFRIFLSGIATLQGYDFLLEGAYHDAAGLFAFGLAGILLYASARLLQRPGAARKTRPIKAHVSAAGGRLAPVTLTLSLCLLFGGSGWAIKDMSSLMRIPEREQFSSFPMLIGDWQGTPGSLTGEVVEGLGSDDYIMASYQKEGLPGKLLLLIPYYNYQDSTRAAHAPQSCLLGGGWDLEHSTVRGFQVAPGKTIDVGLMHLRKGETRMLGSYFFYQRGRVISNPWWNKYYLMLDALTRRRTDGALVRVELTVSEGQNIDETEKMLADFLIGLWPLLPEYVPG